MIEYYKTVKLPTKSALAREFGIVEKSFRNTVPEKLLIYKLGLLKKQELGIEIFNELCKETKGVKRLSEKANKHALLILGMMYKAEIDSKENLKEDI